MGGRFREKKIKSKWKGFLDDCFILLDKSLEKLEVFHKLLDEINPNIKLTIDTSEKQLPFLNVFVKKRNKRIITDIYYKVTDTHQYLHFGSCHSHHTKNEADKVAKSALEFEIEKFKIPSTDLKHFIKLYVNSLLQIFWEFCDTSKLFYTYNMILTLNAATKFIFQEFVYVIQS